MTDCHVLNIAVAVADVAFLLLFDAEFKAINLERLLTLVVH